MATGGGLVTRLWMLARMGGKRRLPTGAQDSIVRMSLYYASLNNRSRSPWAPRQRSLSHSTGP
ncbi:hypothetical protein SBA6_400007 [Candidatus Sulfopaludibacter sp. SbA6]|nr:hypothetical protein SBA6_400007 [Candidatus Sulfopaludibacter sp. SbA6]